MTTNQTETSTCKVFFSSQITAISAVLFSAILLISAYSIPWLACLIWIAFVPFLLATQGRKHMQVYLFTLLLALLYTSLIIYVSYLWKTGDRILILGLFISMIVLISETQLLSRLFKSFWWIALPVIWTIILFLFGQVEPGIAEQLSTFVTIIPVSQPIFQLVAGNYGLYGVLFAVLIVNALVSEALMHYQKVQKYIIFSILFVFLSLCSFAGGFIKDIPISSPEAQGMDSKALTEMAEIIPVSYPQISSIVVVRHGQNVFEKYYQGCTRYTMHNVYSVTKSFTGALTGIALDDGYIRNVDQRIIDYFPEYNTQELDKRTALITVKDILTMTSGFDWDESSTDPSTFIYKSKDWIKSTIELPILFDRGQFFNYNTPSVHILSGIIKKTTHLKPLQYADRKLFGQLGIYRRLWFTDPQGINLGGSNLFLRSRDMAKFGYLYLKEGSWKDQQVISSQWVKESVRKQSDGDFVPYGYLFWITDADGHKAYYSAGLGGQYIYVVPDLDIVIAITCNFNAYVLDTREIFTKCVIPAIKE